MVSKSYVKDAQRFINNGDAWHFEGSVGRACMEMIKAGYCTLGKTGHRDYYGNYVPSRYEVKPGSVGSIGFVKKMRKQREEEPW